MVQEKKSMHKKGKTMINKTRKTNHALRIDYEHFPTGRGLGKI